MDRFNHKNQIFWLDCRFYQCFESIQLYGVSLVQLVDDLEGGRLEQEHLKIYSSFSFSGISSSLLKLC